MSQIPRRGTRLTRALPDENATRKLTRAGSRTTKDGDDAQPVKDILKDATTAAAVTRGRSTLDAAAQKRKREALGEVTNGKSKNGVAAKAKERTALRSLKEPQGAATRPVLATRASATTTTTSAATSTRPALRTRTSTSAAAGTSTGIPRRVPHADGDINEQDDDAMAIDEPHPEPAAAALVRQSSVVSLSNGAVVRRQSSKQLVVEVPHLRHGAAGPLRQSRKQLVVRQTNVEVDEDEEEERRAHKKRRTSSEADELEQQERERQLQVLSSDDNVAAPAPVLSLHEQLQRTHELAEETSKPDAGWEDLDAEDADDPLMVAEYVVEIFNYLKSIEVTTMPNPNYMKEQQSITWPMRGTLVDWMISVHTRFRFLPETLFLAVNILDRFLSMRLASVEKLQLVGAAALFVAAKTEEMFTPGVQRFVEIADNAFTDAEILKAEKYMLKIIEWNLSYPNPINFLRRVSKADEYNIKVRTLAKFFCEIGIVEWRMLHVPPSLLAAAAMWLGRLVLGQGEWTSNLVHYSSYTEEAIIPVANLMINYLLKPKKHENFWKKYASKKFYKASHYMRDWAQAHWPGNAAISLADHLDDIRAEVVDQLAAVEEDVEA